MESNEATTMRTSKTEIKKTPATTKVSKISQANTDTLKPSFKSPRTSSKILKPIPKTFNKSFSSKSSKHRTISSQSTTRTPPVTAKSHTTRTTFFTLPLELRQSILCNIVSLEDFYHLTVRAGRLYFDQDPRGEMLVALRSVYAMSGADEAELDWVGKHWCEHVTESGESRRR